MLCIGIAGRFLGCEQQELITADCRIGVRAWRHSYNSVDESQCYAVAAPVDGQSVRQTECDIVVFVTSVRVTCKPLHVERYGCRGGVVCQCYCRAIAGSHIPDVGIVFVQCHYRRTSGLVARFQCLSYLILSGSVSGDVSAYYRCLVELGIFIFAE